MEVPKTLQEFAIWVGMQFPVLASAALIASLVNRWGGKQRQELVAELKRAFTEVSAEKEKRIAERDERIRQLEAERDELKARLSRPKKKQEDES